MVFFNYSTMQMAAKVVYYGPGLCGKTTNLQWIFDHTSKDSRGEMVSLATETDRTLFFDLLPIDVGSIAGFSTRIQLYTVPGQVFYNTTRKLVLKGVDGVVFVADSQRPMLQANIESFQNLEENLAEMGLSLDTIPVVLQYNKRDLPNIATVEELDQALNRNNWGAVEASALNGDGVLETLKTISKATLLALKKRLTKGRSEGSGAAASSSATKARPAPPRKPIPAPPAAAKPAAAPAQPAAQQPTAPPATAPRTAPPKAAPTAPAAAAPAPTPAPSASQPVPIPAAQPTAPAAAAPPVTASQPLPQVSTAPEQPSVGEVRQDLEKDDGHSTGPVPIVAESTTPPATSPAAAPAGESSEAVPFSEDTAITQTDIKPAPKKARKKKRAAGFDALAELEKLRQESKSASKNGKQEFNKDFRLTLKKSALSRAQRFSLTLQLEDADRQVVDEVQQLHVDIDKLQALDRMLLRLNIDLDPKS